MKKKECRGASLYHPLLIPPLLSPPLPVSSRLRGHGPWQLSPPLCSHWAWRCTPSSPLVPAGPKTPRSWGGERGVLARVPFPEAAAPGSPRAPGARVAERRQVSAGETERNGDTLFSVLLTGTAGFLSGEPSRPPPTLPGTTVCSHRHPLRIAAMAPAHTKGL